MIYQKSSTRKKVLQVNAVTFVLTLNAENKFLIKLFKTELSYSWNSFNSCITKVFTNAENQIAKTKPDNFCWATNAITKVAKEELLLSLPNHKQMILLDTFKVSSTLINISMSSKCPAKIQLWPPKRSLTSLTSKC